jgi:hypothetical protein
MSSALPNICITLHAYSLVQLPEVVAHRTQKTISAHQRSSWHPYTLQFGSAPRRAVMDRDSHQNRRSRLSWRWERRGVRGTDSRFVWRRESDTETCAKSRRGDPKFLDTPSVSQHCYI